MGLFEKVQNEVVVSPELRLIPEFAAVIKADKDRNKQGAVKIFAYIYFVYDYRSPYIIFLPEERKKRVLKDLKLEEKALRAPEVVNAITVYLELNETPVTLALTKTKDTLLTSLNVLEKIRTRIENITSEEEVDSGTLAEALDLITSTLTLAERIPKNITALGMLEEKIKKDLSENSKIRGGGSANPYEE